MPGDLVCYKSDDECGIDAISPAFYSLYRLARITTLNHQGMNLTAIARILELEDANADLTARCDRLQARLAGIDEPEESTAPKH